MKILSIIISGIALILSIVALILVYRLYKNK